MWGSRAEILQRMWAIRGPIRGRYYYDRSIGGSG
jgi:hypothetical protein